MRIYGTKTNDKMIAVTKMVKPFMMTEVIAFYSQEDEFFARQYAEMKLKEDKTVGLVYMTNKEIAEIMNPNQEVIDDFNSTYRAFCD